MSFEPIVSIAAGLTSPAREPAPSAPAAGAATTPPYAVVSREVTPTLPPGFTQTQTIQADGLETTVITNATGSTVDTIYGTSTNDTAGSQLSVWA